MPDLQNLLEKLAHELSGPSPERFTDRPVEALLAKHHAYQVEFSLSGQADPVHIRIQPDLTDPRQPKAIVFNPDITDWQNHPYAFSLPINSCLELFDAHANGPLIPLAADFIPGRTFHISLVTSRHRQNLPSLRFATDSSFLLGNPTLIEISPKDIIPLRDLHLDDVAFPNPLMDRSQWQRTQLLYDRLKSNPFYEEGTGPDKVGFFLDCPIISRDTQINGGVYLGAGPHEAIVVDDRNYPTELHQVYGQVIALLAQSDGKTVLQKVYGIVETSLGGSQDPNLVNKVHVLVDKLVAKHGDDTKVPLNEFIQKKLGFCRHRAVLAAYILERLVREGRLSGRVSVDRNDIPGLGGHAWARWTEPSGQVFILDSSIGYVGPLATAPAVWNYRRPGE